MRNKIITILLYSLLGMCFATAQIAQMEYFVDNDPGYGNATAIAIASGMEVDASFTLDASSLPNGFHTLGIRSMLADNSWGATRTRSFYKHSIGSEDDVKAIEYFIDTDPGVGSGTSVTVSPGVDVAVSFTPDFTELANGFHTIGIRSQLTSGMWGATRTRSFYKHNIGADDDISAMEYFVDTDPGVGSATSITVSSGQDLSVDFTPDFTALSNGFHTIGMRSKLTSGLWGATRTRSFYKHNVGVNDDISAMEYFVDIDPGVGSATSITVSSGHNVSVDLTPDLTALSDGFHTIGTRLQLTSGTWGATRIKTFYKNSAISSDNTITLVEYFIDDDPGYGNGITVNNSESNKVFNQAIDIDFSSLDIGEHTLFIRSQDSDGNWSHVLTSEFCKGTVPQFSIPSEVCVNTLVSITDQSTNAAASTTYSWDYDGDGTEDATGNGNKYRNFATVGTYEVSLTVSDGGGCSSTYVDTIKVLASATPSVSIVADNTEVCEGDDVIFRSTAEAKGNAPTYRWLLNGEAIVGAVADTLRINTLISDDEIQCELTSDYSCMAEGANAIDTSDVVSVTVNTIITPSVSISVQAGTMKQGSTPIFVASVSDAGNSPTFNWLLNGSPLGVTTSSLSMPGLQQGMFVSCEVSIGTDVQCFTVAKDTSNVVMVDFTGIAPVADFSVNARSGLSPLDVQFADASTDAPTAWQWNFGDGSAISTEQSPSHQYTNAGVYTVTLMTSNAFGTDMLTRDDYITVNAPTSEITFVDWNGTELKTEIVDYGSDATAPTSPTRTGHAFSGWDTTFVNISESYTVTAQYTINSYTVTFVDWNGTELKSETVDYGSDATAPANPTRTGYSFSGWDTTFVNISESYTVTAQYTINSYTVTFVDWNGTELKSETVDYGSDATAPANPTRTGYSFSGWNTTFVNISESYTVTAEYTINSYTVTFVDWNGTELKVETVDYGSDATAPAQPIRPGYTFSGWDTTFVNISGSYTVTAKYVNNTIDSYTVTFVDWDGTMIKTEVVNDGNDATAPAQPERIGYSFSGWDATFVNISESYTVTAEYTVNSYTVTFTDWDGTELKAEIVVYGNDATAPTQPERNGYTFSGWDTTFVSISESYTVTAEYIVNSYMVTFADWNGTELKAEMVDYGSDATAPTQPERNGYTFSGWDITFVNISESYTVTAQYIINSYAVTFTDWDGTELKTETVDYGSDATAPTQPERTGYTFSGWDAAFVNISESYTVTAQYIINSYTVTFADWDGTVLKVETVDYGSDAEAPAQPERSGYTFSGWDTTFVSISTNYTVTAKYVNNTINSYTVIFADWDGTELKVEVVNEGGDATAPTNPIRTGYTFSGWDTTFVIISESYTVTAEYTINSYTATFTISDGNMVLNNAILSCSNVDYACDQDGIVKIIGLLANSYTFTVSAIGFETVDSTFTISGDTNISVVMQRASAIGVIAKQSIRLYPNPARSMITVEGACNSNVSIYTLSGTMVLSSSVTTDIFELNIDHLKQGVYIFRAYEIVTRFIVE